MARGWRLVRGLERASLGLTSGLHAKNDCVSFLSSSMKLLSSSSSSSPSSSSSSPPSSSLFSRRWSASAASTVQVEVEQEVKEEREIKEEQEVKEEKDVPTVQSMHTDLWEVLGKGQLPSRQRFHRMLQQCSTPDDIQLAFMTTERLRVMRAVRRQMSNFGVGTSLLLMRACIKAGDLERALSILYKCNVWGLTPSMEAAYELLVHLALKGDVKTVQKVLKTMAKNGLQPTPETGTIVTRAFKGDVLSMMKIAREFEVNGVGLSPKTLDRCMMTAASFGYADDVLHLQKIKEERGIAATAKSIFSLTQARLLVGDVQGATDVIKSYEMDKRKRNHGIGKMVKLWPRYIHHRQAEGITQVNLSELKDKLAAMIRQLNESGMDVNIDVEKDFPSMETMATAKAAESEEADTEKDEESDNESDDEEEKNEGGEREIQKTLW